jgi:protein-L-isoaspartate(D-aspartate) O-methyltransferase
MQKRRLTVRLKSTLLAVWLLALFPLPAAADGYEAERAALIDEVRRYARMDRPSGIDEKVLQAMMRVERHEFVPPNARGDAYANHPLPIGHGQTISQPYIVALMTDLLRLSSGDAVLEVGTGSGYQAAVLAELVKRVYSIEIVEPLAVQVKERLARLEYDNIETRLGDGYFGWPEHAPFDAIIVTAAAGHVPPPLIQQLRPGGRMVIPVGGPFQVQYLLLVEKDEQGEVSSRQVTAVRFVPLTGGH